MRWLSPEHLDRRCIQSTVSTLRQEILTPWAGSRGHINAITTNAPFDLSTPRLTTVSASCVMPVRSVCGTIPQEQCRTDACPTAASRSRSSTRDIVTRSSRRQRLFRHLYEGLFSGPSASSSRPCFSRVRSSWPSRQGSRQTRGLLHSRAPTIGQGSDRKLNEESLRPRAFTLDPNRKLPDRQQ